MVLSIQLVPDLDFPMYLFLLPYTVPNFNPESVLNYIQSGYDSLQGHTPYDNAN